MSEENFNNGDTAALESQIEGILDETPENTEVTDNPEENTQGQETTETKEDKPQIPEQFLNQDGTVNVDDLLKSYNELQPLAEEKTKWEQEKSELQKQADYAKQIQEQALLQAQNLGYQNTEEYALITEIAGATANEYSKYLHTVEEPDKVRGLLALYSKNPTPELLERIEDEFSVDIVKNVSVLAERTKNQILQQQQEQRYETIKQEAETFVQNSIKDFPDWFKIPEFTNFFADALRVKGDRFETAAFIKHLENLKEYFRREFIAEQNANKENNKELDNLKNLTPKSIQQNTSSKNIDDYSPEELDKAIGELV
ncbi:hypothetical protein IJ818_06970 [bacterium]|nr:hypothetical protein [bacterium]